MQVLLKNLKGDKLIWAILFFLALFSFLPIYSAASSVIVKSSSVTLFSGFMKHFFFLFFGFVLTYIMHIIPYRYLIQLSKIGLPIVALLLVLVFIKAFDTNAETTTNNKRWLQLGGIGFQPSTMASVVLSIYVAGYLSKMKDKIIQFKDSIIPLWVPVFIIIALILPSNFSTAAILFTMILTLVYLGGYPKKYIGLILLGGVFSLMLFILVAKAFPNVVKNRVDTWTNRIENFMNSDNAKDSFQAERAKIAVASGKIFGLGPGKSKQKSILPQSNSDFIFAIIVEEYGIVGGLTILIAYMWLLFRILIVAQKSDTIFGKLVTIGVGIPIIFQALINIGVAIQIFPVTGQTLPLISSGGTSILMMCLSAGIILNVSAKRQELKKEEDLNNDNVLDILSHTI